MSVLWLIKGQLKGATQEAGDEKKFNNLIINVMEITGRIVADAAIRTTPSNRELTGFRIAVNRTYKQDGERKQLTSFIDCAYWRGTNVAAYLTKGTLVQLSGWMYAKPWISRDAEAMAGLHLNVDNITFLTASAKNTAQQGNGNKANRN